MNFYAPVADTFEDLLRVIIVFDIFETLADKFLGMECLASASTPGQQFQPAFNVRVEFNRKRHINLRSLGEG